MRRTARHTALPVAIAAAAFVVANGWIHLREWLDVYRDLPAAVPGAALVQIGFPLNAALSVLGAVALLVAVLRHRYVGAAIVANVAVQAGSLAALVITRRGTLLGWTEPVWNVAAEQTRAVELGALACLALLVLLRRQAGAARDMPGVRDGVLGASA